MKKLVQSETQTGFNQHIILPTLEHAPDATLFLTFLCKFCIYLSNTDENQFFLSFEVIMTQDPIKYILYIYKLLFDKILVLYLIHSGNNFHFVCSQVSLPYTYPRVKTERWCFVQEISGPYCKVNYKSLAIIWNLFKSNLKKSS